MVIIKKNNKNICINKIVDEKKEKEARKYIKNKIKKLKDEFEKLDFELEYLKKNYEKIYEKSSDYLSKTIDCGYYEYVEREKLVNKFFDYMKLSNQLLYQKKFMEDKLNDISEKIEILKKALKENCIDIGILPKNVLSIKTSAKKSLNNRKNHKSNKFLDNGYVVINKL